MSNHTNNEAAADRLAGMIRYEVERVLEAHTEALNDRVDELESELREAHLEAVELEKAYELEGAHAADLKSRLESAEDDYQMLLYAAEHGVVS